MNREILERLRVKSKHVTTTETDIFDSNVAESKFRYIVKVILPGDSSSDRTVDIFKKEENGTYTKKFAMIPVPSAEVIELGSDNPEHPILVLEGGTNLAAKVNAGTGITLSVIYWDDEV